MDHWEEMKTFVRVVESGSISRAAEQTGTAKSGVSRRLAELEKRLGVKLINRTTRRSSLTEAGSAYYRGAVKLLGDVAELDASVMESETSLEGMLRLAMPLSFGLSHLSPAISEFLTRHPAVDVQIDFSDRRIDLIEQGVELAIRIADLEDSTLQARKICPIRMVMCASPEYLATLGTPASPGDLSGHQLLQYDSGGRQQLKVRDETGTSHVISGNARIVANNGDFLREMAIAGHGVSVMPRFIVWKALRAGELVPVLEDCTWPELTAWAVYPRNRYLSHRARAFIDFLVDRFGDEPYWDHPDTGL